MRPARLQHLLQDRQDATQNLWLDHEQIRELQKAKSASSIESPLKRPKFKKRINRQRLTVDRSDLCSHGAEPAVLQRQVKHQLHTHKCTWHKWPQAPQSSLLKCRNKKRTQLTPPSALMTAVIFPSWTGSTSWWWQSTLMEDCWIWGGCSHCQTLSFNQAHRI